MSPLFYWETFAVETFFQQTILAEITILTCSNVVIIRTRPWTKNFVDIYYVTYQMKYGKSLTVVIYMFTTVTAPPQITKKLPNIQKPTHHKLKLHERTRIERYLENKSY